MSIDVASDFGDEVVLPDPVIVRDLAFAIRQKPHVILADLMALNVFSNLNEKIRFEIAAKIARKYGYDPKRKA